MNVHKVAHSLWQNVPFADNGHMVQKTLSWRASYSVCTGTTKTKKIKI